MKVKDAIRFLKQFPPEFEIWYDTGDAFGEQATSFYEGFVTDAKEGRGTLWHDPSCYEEVEGDEDEAGSKYRVIVIS